MGDSCDGIKDVFFDDPNACHEYREVTRRAFMRMASMPAAFAAPLILPRIVLGGGIKNGQEPDILIYVFERGGKDAWAAMAGYNHPYWSQPYTTAGGVLFPNGLRPVVGNGGDLDGIGLDVPDEKDPDPFKVRYQHLGELNGDLFGINKAYTDRDSAVYSGHETLLDFYNFDNPLDGEVAFIPCAGSPDRNRSHFEAEDLIEYGTPNQPASLATGWLTRYLQLHPATTCPLQAAAFTLNSLMPTSMAFSEKSMAMQQIADVIMPGNPATQAAREAILRQRYEEQTQDPLRGTVLTAIETANLLSGIDVQPDPAAHFTNDQFGVMCMNLCALLKAGVCVRTAMLETGGHDTHAWEGPYLVEPQAYNGSGQVNLTGGALYNNTRKLSQNLAAMRIDCQDIWDRMCVIVHSEFGRQVDMNGDMGTDHANAGLMTVFGGRVQGGIYSKRSLGGEDGWPSLHPDNMSANHDQDGLRTTMDYRVVLGEILRKCMLVPQTELDNDIFPTVGEQPPPVVPFDAGNELGIIQ